MPDIEDRASFVSPFELNLEAIIVKALDPEEGYGWALQFGLAVEREYKRYLYLCAIYPGKALVPSVYVDDFWHLHILDTLKYAEDCEILFGEFLHHFPYFGMRGEQDAANLAAAWAETLDLYRSEFGEEPSADLWPRSQRCPNCGRRCKDSRSNYQIEDERPTLAGLNA